MVLGIRWLFSIGNGAEIWPLEKGRKYPGKIVVREFNIPTFVLTMATRAAYTWVKVGEAACACMIDLAIRPLKHINQFKVNVHDR